MLSVFNIKYLKVVSRTTTHLVLFCGGLDDRTDWVSKNVKVTTLEKERCRIWEMVQVTTLGNFLWGTENQQAGF
jgi:hypothetical protein